MLKKSTILQQRYTQRRKKAFGMCPEVRLFQTGLIQWVQSEINWFAKLIFFDSIPLLTKKVKTVSLFRGKAFSYAQP